VSDPLAKTDPALKRRLADATSDEPVSAVLELATPLAMIEPAPLGGTHSAVEQRRVARARALEMVARATSGTITALDGLGLAPRGGRILPFVVVRGAVAAIRSALDLPGVTSAALDTDTSDMPPQTVEKQ
jgi:hypothetical protein